MKIMMAKKKYGTKKCMFCLTYTHTQKERNHISFTIQIFNGSITIIEMRILITKLPLHRDTYTKDIISEGWLY